MQTIDETFIALPNHTQNQFSEVLVFVLKSEEFDGGVFGAVSMHANRYPKC